MATSDQTIPVLDLDDFRAGGEREARFVQALGDSFVDTGFAALIHHGVDLELARRATAVAASFFDLPEATKLRYEDSKGLGQRGYTAFGREHAKEQPVPDLKEFWHVGRDLPAGDALEQAYAPNVWPEEIPGFRAIMSALYGQLEICGDQLLEACALHLGEDRALFREMARDGDSVLRVLHYPPIPADAHPASIRAAAHEDINLMTLLLESTAPGLELLQRDGAWRKVHSLAGQIIVDTGDMMARLSNGYFKSTTHRVVNPDSSHDRRFSMPFFIHPRHAVMLSARPSALARTGGQAAFPPIAAGDYLTQRLRAIGLGQGT
jgi:isopenicillin N synthase-like dioxygenase